MWLTCNVIVSETLKRKTYTECGQRQWVLSEPSCNDLNPFWRMKMIRELDKRQQRNAELKGIRRRLRELSASQHTKENVQ